MCSSVLNTQGVFQNAISKLGDVSASIEGIPRGAFLAPFLYGLYWKGTTKAAVWTNIVFSTVFMIANMVAKPYFPIILRSPINAGAFCMIFGLVLVPVVSLFTKKFDEKHTEDVFMCYNKKVTVDIKDHIG